MDTLTSLLGAFGIKLSPQDSEDACGKASQSSAEDPSEPSMPRLLGKFESSSSSTGPSESRTASSESCISYDDTITQSLNLKRLLTASLQARSELAAELADARKLRGQPSSAIKAMEKKFKTLDGEVGKL